MLIPNCGHKFLVGAAQTVAYRNCHLSLGEPFV